MGEAKDRGSREARLAAAIEREDVRRREWADEMVADAAALLEAALRVVAASHPNRAPDRDPGDDERAEAYALATLAAQRAVATDLLDAVAPQDDTPDDEEPDEPEPPAKPAKAPFSLVTPPSKKE